MLFCVCDLDGVLRSVWFVMCCVVSVESLPALCVKNPQAISYTLQSAAKTSFSASTRTDVAPTPVDVKRSVDLAVASATKLRFRWNLSY